MTTFFKRLWIRLTYWTVPCESCNGTGICCTLQAGKPPAEPHSCCGDCNRKIVPKNQVPEGFMSLPYENTVTIGDGIMYRRPWSSRQVQRPRLW